MERVNFETLPIQLEGYNWRSRRKHFNVHKNYNSPDFLLGGKVYSHQSQADPLLADQSYLKNNHAHEDGHTQKQPARNPSEIPEQKELQRLKKLLSEKEDEISKLRYTKSSIEHSAKNPETTKHQSYKQIPRAISPKSPEPPGVKFEQISRPRAQWTKPELVPGRFTPSPAKQNMGKFIPTERNHNPLLDRFQNNPLFKQPQYTKMRPKVMGGNPITGFDSSYTRNEQSPDRKTQMANYANMLINKNSNIFL
mmetsp:Transcript_16291/g.23583  ORF Transcript_16291/g.23583 Transcript_16291/m.23583 type:complete len:252 (+) Transcript_16291:16-771(+)